MDRCSIMGDYLGHMTRWYVNIPNNIQTVRNEVQSLKCVLTIAYVWWNGHGQYWKGCYYMVANGQYCCRYPNSQLNHGNKLL